MVDEKKLIEDIIPVLKKLSADDAREVMEVIKSQQKVGEWIPCSERLPGKYELCLITQKIGTQKVRKVVLRLLGEWKFNGRKIKDEAVTAWMPLPEPYREEK